jgi:hypothetical protein
MGGETAIPDLPVAAALGREPKTSLDCHGGCGLRSVLLQHGKDSVANPAFWVFAVTSVVVALSVMTGLFIGVAPLIERTTRKDGMRTAADSPPTNAAGSNTLNAWRGQFRGCRSAMSISSRPTRPSSISLAYASRCANVHETRSSHEMVRDRAILFRKKNALFVTRVRRKVSANPAEIARPLPTRTGFRSK